MRTLFLVAAISVLGSTPAWAQGQQRSPSAGPPTTSATQAQQRIQQQRQAERAATGDRTVEHERLQMRERERDRDKERVSKPAAAGVGTYGGNLMTAEERLQYRERLVAAKTEAERARIEARHRERMERRARERGIAIEVTED